MLSVESDEKPKITLQGFTVGNNYSIESTHDLQSPWQPVANLALDSKEYIWEDTNITDQDFRFYRVRPAKLQSYNPPPPGPNPEKPVLTRDDVLGSYERLPIQNNWHEGTIIRGNATALAWRNKANRSWNLIPDFNNQKLRTDHTCPYPGQDFHLSIIGNQLVGFYFNGELYKLKGTTIPGFESSTLRGYMGAHYSRPVPSQYSYGFSFYTAIWSLLDEPLAGFQVGLPGTWLLPNNNDFFQPLLPPGNFIRELMPERGPYWRDVFQTIEGSGGSWVSTKFPTTVPKYRMNGTINGYINEVSSPGWGFGQTSPLPPNAMGLAQLSNRLLVPPDGLTFDKKPGGEFLGKAWMALPIIPTRPNVGDQSWTFFISASNFKGALAFYVPQIWERYAEVYPTVLGRGLDSRPGIVGPFTMELGAVPMDLQTSGAGKLYAKIPRLLFPTDGKDKTYLATDMARYSKSAMFNEVSQWFAGGQPVEGRFKEEGTYTPSLGVNPLGFSHGANRQLILFSQFVRTAILDTPGGGKAFGLKWSPNSKPGVLPEFFIETPSGLDAIPEEQLPEDIKLKEKSFALANEGGPYTSPTSWQTPAPSSSQRTVRLSDGSRVTYAWYKFVDQPSVQAFKWTTEEKEIIQSRIEKIHNNWSTELNFMPPPTGGVLTTLDPALLVTPPEGLEVGYVPIVIRQR